MEAIIVIAVSYIAGMVSEMLYRALKRDDGLIVINDEKWEVIFKDSYEKLVKKKKVNLKIQS